MNNPDNSQAISQASLFKGLRGPRYWPLWIGIGVMKIICKLPLRTRWQTGRLLGRLAHRIATRRRNIVRTNLRLCFPDLDDDALTDLTRRNFESTGISLIETALVWFEDPHQYADLVDIEGLEHLKKASQSGKGVILLGMHLSTLDFCGAALATVQPFDVMYRKNKNRLLEAIMTRGRENNFDSAIERDNVKQVIRRLKEGAIVWYGPDQDYGRKHSVFASLFGQPAATITATSRIAGITGSTIIPYRHYRDLEAGRYRIILDEPLADFPGNSVEEDCEAINRLVEKGISVAPEQYWWVHRRFKTQPEGLPRPYDMPFESLGQTVTGA